MNGIKDLCLNGNEELKEMCKNYCLIASIDFNDIVRKYNNKNNHNINNDNNINENIGLNNIKNNYGNNNNNKKKTIVNTELTENACFKSSKKNRKKF